MQWERDLCGQAGIKKCLWSVSGALSPSEPATIIPLWDDQRREREKMACVETQGRPLLWFWQTKEPTVRRNSENRKQGESTVGFLSRDRNRKLFKIICCAFLPPSLSSFFGEGRGTTVGVCVLVQYFHSLERILHESQKQVLLERNIYFKL